MYIFSIYIKFKGNKMLQTKIKKLSNSTGLRFPKHILQDAHINVGNKLNISISEGQIIIEPLNDIKNKYDIKELVSKIPKNYSSTKLDWGNSVGKEEW